MAPPTSACSESCQLSPTLTSDDVDDGVSMGDLGSDDDAANAEFQAQL